MTTKPPIAKLGHVAIHTPDLDESLWFFEDVLGLYVVERDDETAYLRAQRDWEHHTLRITESGQQGVDHIAFRTSSPEALDELAEGFEAEGTDVTYVDADERKGHGEAIRVEKFGHPYEFYYDVEKPDAPDGERSGLKNRIYSETDTNRIAPRRIDHVHVQDEDETAKEHAAWLQDELGFQLNEQYRAGDGELWGWWFAVTALPHDIAIHREPAGSPSEFHHLSYHLDSLHDLWSAADILSEEGIEPDGGPGRHAITRADFLYVSDPASGFRIELFAGPGYLNFEPDWEPIEWTESDIGGETSHQWVGQGPDWNGLGYVDE
ncbi:VOC family protein [Natrarchaeobius chitinivorans]|uniref:Lactoylglutathione lyase n=1 Tax=Natrarchaeobius chitinivorans TaxID=1679083 RepID=A0A3N6LX61_NATCH|nr:VOC family protein [Natrarchaeobius chitinivorans]RQG93537.1 lactoylglutathione lyase [Natrarchaeobius chitinivorans]